MDWCDSKESDFKKTFQRVYFSNNNSKKIKIEKKSREEGASVRCRLHSGRADNRFSHRLLHPARAALPWKVLYRSSMPSVQHSGSELRSSQTFDVQCAGICSCDWRSVSSAVGQEAGSLALSFKRY
jgi:hypothetical protein